MKSPYVKRILALFVMFLIACSPTSPPQPEPTPYVVTVAPELSTLTGRVVDLDGQPLSNAKIDSDTSSSMSSADGSFSLPGIGHPQWVRVSLDGYIVRTRAVAPDQPTIFRLSPNDGHTAVLQFAGDVMFGRRFFDPNEDGDPSDGLLPLQPDASDHLKLMASIQPLLRDADLTIVNLESPISEEPYLSPRDSRPTAYHSTKDYVFSSHPSAIEALKQAGIDLVDLGNNHAYDLLEDGLIKTTSVLQENGLAYFGAGGDEGSAWEPAIVNVDGQEIAFIGCTTIWRPIPPTTDNDVSYVAQDEVPKGGAARCEENRLSRVINVAHQQSDLVVVMIHGGFEYSRTPSTNVEKFSNIAREAGATLVINHHPHVVGGLAWDAPTLTAWTLGNFIFDQTVWPTFQSCVLTVYIRDGQIVRAFAEPIIISDYIPHGLTGRMADFVARGISGQVPGQYVIEAGALEVDLTERAEHQTSTQALSGDSLTGTIFPIPDGQWVSAYNGTGAFRLGRDILWVGSFEPEMIQDNHVAPVLWIPGESQQFGPEFAYQGVGGIRLTRSKSNQTDAVTTHLHRILVTTGKRLTITGMVRPAPGALASLQISWYADTKGPSEQRLSQILPVEANGEWQPFRVDVQVPSGITAIGILVRLSPPVNGTTSLDLDDLRLIEWADPQADFNPLYTHMLLTGEGTVSFQQDSLSLLP